MKNRIFSPQMADGFAVTLFMRAFSLFLLLQENQDEHAELYVQTTPDTLVRT